MVRRAYLQKGLEDGFLHVAPAILGLVEDELVEVVLQVVGHSRAAVAVVDAEEGQVGIGLEVREGRASEVKNEET